jgi:hypothetical protein
MSSITTRLYLLPKAESARLARSALEPVRQFLDKTRFEDLRLVIHELIIEAVGGLDSTQRERISLQVECDADRVRASIGDGASAYFLPSRVPQPGEVGWAVYLVQRLADVWGVRRDGDRSAVWVEFSREPNPQ